MLEALITGSSKRAVLSALFTDPNKTLYMREICRITGRASNEVLSELKKLEEASIIESSRSGNHVFYKPNKNCPIFPELKQIIYKTVGILSQLKLMADEIFGENGGVKFIFIFGSFANSTENSKSDVDILILTRHGLLAGETDIIITKYEQKLAREINYFVYPETSFFAKLNTGFVNNVVKEKKIFLKGDEDGFKRFVEGR